MGETTGIQWCDHTFNAWEGCARVSPGCENCYAEARNARFHVDEERTRLRRETNGNKAPVATHWGVNAPRLMRSESYWNGPLKWDRQARRDGVRRRVFCSSLADVFEDRPDLVEPRQRLLRLIEECDHLDWLLLTKRPENMVRLTPVWEDGWPSNVWAGTTAEDQKRADERASVLLEVPAAVRFLSCEPLLERVDLWAFFKSKTRDESLRHLNTIGVPGIDWVIVGGESGPGARPCAVEWIEDVVAQCRRAGVAAFVKQTGAYVVSEHRTGPAELWPDNNRPPAVPGRPGEYWAWRAGLGDDKKGSTLESIADEFRVRMFPGDPWPASALEFALTREGCPF